MIFFIILIMNSIKPQKTAKKFRNGIKYTELLRSTLGAFSRPKVWSQTRMVLYELDMLDRFLENKVYYEVSLKFW